MPNRFDEVIFFYFVLFVTDPNEWVTDQDVRLGVALLLLQWIMLKPRNEYGWCCFMKYL